MRFGGWSRNFDNGNKIMSLETRIIIGETELAGLPISAPCRKDNDEQWPTTTIRWRKAGTHFVLEQWKLENPKGPTRWVWVEVPCVEPPNN